MTDDDPIIPRTKIGRSRSIPTCRINLSQERRCAQFVEYMTKATFPGERLLYFCETHRRYAKTVTQRKTIPIDVDLMPPTMRRAYELDAARRGKSLTPRPSPDATVPEVDAPQAVATPAPAVLTPVSIPVHAPESVREAAVVMLAQMQLDAKAFQHTLPVKPDDALVSMELHTARTRLVQVEQELIDARHELSDALDALGDYESDTPTRVTPSRDGKSVLALGEKWHASAVLAAAERRVEKLEAENEDLKAGLVDAQRQIEKLKDENMNLVKEGIALLDATRAGQIVVVDQVPADQPPEENVLVALQERQDSDAPIAVTPRAMHPMVRSLSTILSQLPKNLSMRPLAVGERAEKSWRKLDVSTREVVVRALREWLRNPDSKRFANMPRRNPITQTVDAPIFQLMATATYRVLFYLSNDMYTLFDIVSRSDKSVYANEH